MQEDLGLFSIILGILGIATTIAITIYAWWKKSKTHQLIIIFLVLFLVQNYYIAFKSYTYADKPIAPLVLLTLPLIIFIIYFIVLKVKLLDKKTHDELSNLGVNKSTSTDSKKLFEGMLENIERHGVEAISTLQVLAETFDGTHLYVIFSANDIVIMLIKKVKEWRKLEDKGNRENLDHLAGATITTIANISVVNDIQIGKDFINSEVIQLLEHKKIYSNDPIILNSIETANEILLTRKPNFLLYGVYSPSSQTH